MTDKMKRKRKFKEAEAVHIYMSAKAHTDTERLPESSSSGLADGLIRQSSRARHNAWRQRLVYCKFMDEDLTLSLWL